MIIKSMSRKEPSFAQLIDYVTRGREDERFDLYHNLYSRRPGDMLGEFEDNAKLLPKRKNGVTLYHEILSITKTGAISLDEQKEALSQIARRYISERANENLVFGGLHEEKDNNLHYHLIMSANGAGVSKRTRLTKAQFGRIQKDLEAHVLQNYPQLQQSVAINKQAQRKLSPAGAALQKRSGRMPRQEAVIEKLQRLFAAGNKAEAAALLRMEGIEFYQRGKTIGIVNLETGKKHRLGTLGLMEAYADFKTRIERTELQVQTASVQNAETAREQAETDVQNRAALAQAETARQAAAIETEQRRVSEADRQERERRDTARQTAERTEAERLNAERVDAQRQRQLAAKTAEFERLRQLEEAERLEETERLQRVQETTREIERQRRAVEARQQQQAAASQREEAQRLAGLTQQTRAIDAQARTDVPRQSAMPPGLRDMLEARREQLKQLRQKFRRNGGRTHRD